MGGLTLTTPLFPYDQLIEAEAWAARRARARAAELRGLSKEERARAKVLHVFEGNVFVKKRKKLLKRRSYSEVATCTVACDGYCLADQR